MVTLCCRPGGCGRQQHWVTGRGWLSHRDEIQRAYALEYGDRFEPIVRLSGVTVGSGILFAYTGWYLSLAWAGFYLLTHLIYFTFLRAHLEKATEGDVRIASAIFAKLLVTFIWMPVYIICQQDQAMSVAGAALFGCILVFLVRRSDTRLEQIAAHVIVIGASTLIVLGVTIPKLGNPLAQAGLALAGLALVFYFAQSLLQARKIKLEAAEAAEQFHQARKMQAVGRMAGGIAHDFNNNLTAIIGHLELLKELEDETERAASIEDALVAARQGAKTVRQLLLYARKEPTDVGRHRLGDIMNQLDPLVRNLVPDTIDIDLIGEQSDLEIVADQNQLLTGLINLVMNAVDAMPDGGQLSISPRISSVDRPLPMADGLPIQPGRYVAIAVRDTGTGIPPEILPQVIDPFFTTKAMGKATGLGLPMVVGISRRFGGGLDIRTGETGTDVTIYLPLARSDASEEERPDPVADRPRLIG